MKHDTNAKVKRRHDKVGIDIPFSQQTLSFSGGATLTASPEAKMKTVRQC